MVGGAPRWNELGYPYEEAAARFHVAEAMLAGTEGRCAAARFDAAPNW